MLSENIKERLFTAPRGKAIILGIGVSNLPLAEMLADMGADIEIRDGKEFDALGRMPQKSLPTAARYLYAAAIPLAGFAAASCKTPSSSALPA